MTKQLKNTIAIQARFMPNFAHLLCDDIVEDQFANRFGSTINHPAFVLGHISYYAGICVEMLGGKIEFESDEAALFQMKVECTDDADSYPDKTTLLARFKERCETSAAFIESCGDEVLEQSAKDTPFAGRFETLGQVASFMLMGHPSFHLGQISAWRRVAGMGSAT